MNSPGERVRLFVALELPDEAREALIEWRSPVLAGADGLRAITFEHLHVTLCFLGWQPEVEVVRVADACREVSGRGVFELALDEGVWLPPRRPRVLAVRLEDRDGRLTQLQADLSPRLQAGGWYEPERRTYLPHVTVARVGRQARISAGALPEVPPIAITASRITLFRSHLSPRGARYEALATVGGG